MQKSEKEILFDKIHEYLININTAYIEGRLTLIELQKAHKAIQNRLETLCIPYSELHKHKYTK